MEAPVAVFRHSLTVYAEMENQSRLVTVEGIKMLVYEGKLTELVVNTCELSVPYYSKVTQALKGMGCCRQLRRGGGPSLSQWELIKEPTVELYEEYISTGEQAEEPTQFATKQEVRDVNNRLMTVEKALGIRT
jgi:hypothetical protein